MIMIYLIVSFVIAIVGVCFLCWNNGVNIQGNLKILLCGRIAPSALLLFLPLWLTGNSLEIYQPVYTPLPTKSYELCEIDNSSYYVLDPEGEETEVGVLLRGGDYSVLYYETYNSQLVAFQQGTSPELRVEKAVSNIPLRDKILFFPFGYPEEKIVSVTIICPES